MTKCRIPALALSLLVGLVGLDSTAAAQVKSQAKISAISGYFDPLTDNVRFGIGVTSIGDLDGDGVTDIAAGAYLGGYQNNFPDPDIYWGNIYTMFLNANGTVRSYVEIGNGRGGFTGVIDPYDEFGISVEAIGDLDNDGVVDLAVGARLDDDGAGGANTGTDRGAVWILFMRANGSVRAQQKISQFEGGFTGILDNGDWFGAFTTAVGDLDGDTVEDLVVAAPFDDDGGADKGAFWVLFLNTNGTVKSHQKVSATAGGFAGALDNGDRFGTGPGNIGDVDFDGVVDLAVGAISDDDGGADFGAVWIVYLNSNGTVKGHAKISATTGGFTGLLNSGCGFGSACELVYEGDVVRRIAVSAKTDDDGGSNRGAVYLLDLMPDGTVTNTLKISSTAGGFLGPLHDGDEFGLGLASLGDFDGDGNTDLAVGARLDDDGAGPFDDGDIGAVWLLMLGDCNVSVTPTSHDFGTVTVGSSADADFVIRNNGVGTIDGSVTEACSGFSIVAGGGPYTLAVDESLLVTVRFAPTSQGDYSCTVSTGAPCGSSITVTGSGQEAAPNPTILSIADVPEDQGRRVRVTFARSSYDRPGAPATIRGYEIYRRIDEPNAVAQPLAAPPSEREPLLAGWDFVTTVPNHGESEYNVVVGTLADSTAEAGVRWSVFMVRATTSSAFTFYDSPPDSGYSKDNILPVPPAAFGVTFGTPVGNKLVWTASESEDLLGYKLYRAPHAGDGEATEFVMFTTKTYWTDTQLASPILYALVAVDSSGNESPPINPGQSTNVGGVPKQLSLHQNVPNPFNPSTTIFYDLPAAGRVTITVYDVHGRLVRSLLDRQDAAGTRSVAWDGRDNAGQRVASGTYFYRLQTGGRTLTKKMTLIE